MTEFTYALVEYDFSKMTVLGVAIKARHKGGLIANQTGLIDQTRYVTI